MLGPLGERNGFKLLQLRSEEITKGMSGAPIWDDNLKVVIGMVISLGMRRSIKLGKAQIMIPVDDFDRFRYSAFATPTETLWKIRPELSPNNQCPYRGLEKFTKDDSSYFFGRDRVIYELVESLRRQPQFLAVLGPSGCGKSSLVQAGLLPCLEKEAVVGSNQWQIDTIRPTDFKYNELKNIISSLQQKQQHFGLVIDQFEELFWAFPEEQCQEIVTLLKVLLEESPYLHLILTLRNDFYSHFVRFDALEKWLNKGKVDVPPTLRPEEVREIIQKPVALLEFDDGLIEIIVNDVLEAMHPSFDSKKSGALNTVLPLLEFTLTQLWESRDRNRYMLTRAAYRTIGGVTGGLKQEADKIYKGLAPREQELARRIFIQLVHVNKETLQNPYSCQQMRKDVLVCAIPGEQRMIEQVIQQLVRDRLLVTNRHGEDATIELSHEALIREWPKLRDLLDKAQKDMLFQQSLREDVEEWVEWKEEKEGKEKGKRKQPRDLLYRGDKLKQAKAWMRDNVPNAQQAAFIRASATERSMRLIRVLTVVLLLISSLGIAAWYVLLQPKPTLVTTYQDSGVGSLRWCIANASSGSTITFAQNMTGTIKLTGGDLVFSGDKTLTISGPGANQLVH